MRQGLCDDIRITEQFEKLVEDMASGDSAVVKRFEGDFAQRFGERQC